MVVLVVLVLRLVVQRLLINERVKTSLRRVII